MLFRSVDQEDLLINDKLKLIDKKINDFNSCYYWSKSLSGLNKIKKEEDYKYLVSSKVEGLDMCNLLKCLVRFSRKVKNKGYDNKYEEFYQFRSDFKSQELIVAPNGQEIQLKFLNSSV